MKNLTARMVLLWAIVSLPPVVLHGAAIRRLDFDTLVARSRFIVHARVVGTRSFWDAETRTIWTATELQVLDAAKGSSGRTLIIKEPGGVLGKVGHLFPGVPQFTADEEVVVFLYSGPGDRLRITGLRQGVYGVTTVPGTGQSFVRPLGARQAEVVHERGSRPTPRLITSDEHRLPDFLQKIRQRVR